MIKIENKADVAVIGDSITQMGYYIDFMKEYLDEVYPDNRISFINLGRSGETVSGLCEKDRPAPRGCLFERIDEVKEHIIKADAFIFCYGMNDGVYEPYSENHMQAFKDGINKLCNILRKYNKPILAVTPPSFDGESYYKWKDAQPAPNPEDPIYPQPYINYNKVLDKYSNWIISQEGILFDKAADIHTPLNNYIEEKKKENKDYIYGDGIHPTKDGHYLMAKVILKELTGDEMPNYCK